MAGVLALALGTPALAGCGGGDEPQPAGRLTTPARDFDPGAPNVLVIETDDQAIDTMRAMPKTRRLLGGQGTTFVNSIASFPLCCPSRATFLSGQYAHNHEVLSNRAPRGGYGRLDNRHTLAVWLSRAGYRTAMVGKYLNGYGEEQNGGPLAIPDGWSDWIAVLPTGKTSGFDYELNRNGEVVAYGDEEADYKTDVLAAEAASFVREAARQRRPFFLWVPTDAPHTDPHTDSSRNPEPAPRHFGDFEGTALPDPPSYDEADVSDKPREVAKLAPIDAEARERIENIYVSQLEALRSVDDLVARLIGELRRAAELRRTLVVFTSDNGYMRGQHRIAEGKANVYEEALRVPLLIRGPGFPAGVRTRTVAGNVDLAPTILAATGATREADVPLDGEPLIGAARGGDRDRAILVEIEKNRGPSYVGVRTRRYLYARRGERPGELYDLRRDPYELENLYREPEYRRLRDRLRDQSLRLRACSGRACRSAAGR